MSRRLPLRSTINKSRVCSTFSFFRFVIDCTSAVCIPLYYTLLYLPASSILIPETSSYRFSLPQGDHVAGRARWSHKRKRRKVIRLTCFLFFSCDQRARCFKEQRQTGKKREKEGKRRKKKKRTFNTRDLQKKELKMPMPSRARKGSQSEKREGEKERCNH